MLCASNDFFFDFSVFFQKKLTSSRFTNQSSNCTDETKFIRIISAGLSIFDAETGKSMESPLTPL